MQCCKRKQAQTQTHSWTHTNTDTLTGSCLFQVAPRYLWVKVTLPTFVLLCPLSCFFSQQCHSVVYISAFGQCNYLELWKIEKAKSFQSKEIKQKSSFHINYTFFILYYTILNLYSSCCATFSIWKKIKVFAHICLNGILNWGLWVGFTHCSSWLSFDTLWISVINFWWHHVLPFCSPGMLMQNMFFSLS